MDYQTNTTPVNLAHPWFAVRVKSNCERVVALLLDQRGYQRFLPSSQVRKQWSDRIKVAERLLIPGYVFCSFNPHDRLPIVSTPGVLHVVGVGKEPAPISGTEIQALWTTVTSGLPVETWPFLQSGDRVVVERGALAGVEGIVTHFRGGCRLVVSIALLQRSVAAEIDRDWVRPLAPSRPRGPHRWTSALSSHGVQ